MNPKISKILTTLALVFTLSLGAIAQPPPPPDQHGESENQRPSAPIGGGLLILLTLGAAYGAKKVYDARRRLS